ncbi:MAG: alpha/beta hydrolase [Myxococcota bacterium]|nr:alpha/beta hydrolase [Myxococcota bacterium]
MSWWLTALLWAGVPEAEVHSVQTQDKATISLSHRPGEGPPVLVVHGISSNHRCWDLEGGPSLAAALHASGFDPWLLDLRGHGLAEFSADGQRQRRGGSVDDYGQYDVPAAVAFIQKKTGFDKVHYVGHSMGGMVMAVALHHEPELALDRLVVVGTPMDFSDPDRVTGPLMSLGRWSSALAGYLPAPLAASVHGRFRTPLPVDEWLFVDIQSPVREQLYEQIVSPLYARELRQLEAVGREGMFVSADGKDNYLVGLRGIQQPTLVVAGRGDRIAPPDRVAGFFTEISSEEKRFVIAGRATGFSVDYGHLDLPLGAHAEQEIFPLIVDWLRGEASE